MAKKTNMNLKGAALSLVTLMVFVLTIIGVAILRIGTNAKLTAVHAASEMSARSAADAGLIQAIHLLNKKLEAQEEWDIESFTSPVVQLPNCRANYRFKLEGDPDSGYEIISIGRSGNAEKTVRSQLELTGLFDYAIFVADEIELKMGTTVDAYNLDADDPPLQIATNTIIADALDMKTDVTINGDVIVGPGGDPDLVIDSKLEATIIGETYTLPEEWDLPVIKVPKDLLLAPSKGHITGGEVISTDGKYDDINLSNGLITLVDGDVSLYILGKIELDKLAQLQLAPITTNPDTKLTIYLGGNFTSKNGGVINNTAKDPTRLTIFGLETCTSINFYTEGTFYGAIYAPYADVKLYCEVEVFGSIVAASFLQSVEADFHYDASLQEVEITDIGVAFDINRWWEQ